MLEPDDVEARDAWTEGGGGGVSAAPPPDSRQAGSVPAPPGEQQRAAPQPAAEHCKDALARTYAPDGGPARANPQPQPSHQRDSSSACRRDHCGMAVGSGATAASHSCGGRGVLRARDMHFSSFRAMQRARRAASSLPRASPSSRARKMPTAIESAIERCEAALCDALQGGAACASGEVRALEPSGGALRGCAPVRGARSQRGDAMRWGEGKWQ